MPITIAEKILAAAEQGRRRRLEELIQTPFNNPEERVERWQAKNMLAGDTALHIVIYRQYRTTLSKILQSIIPSERYIILQIRNRNGASPLDDAIEQGSETMVKAILNSLPEQNKLELLKSSSPRGWTALQRAIVKSKANIVKTILQAVERSKRIELANHCYPSGWSVLCRALSLQKPDVFYTILEMLTEDDRLTLLTSPGSVGESILHYIVQKEYLEVLEWILARNSGGIDIILGCQDELGRTLLHLAVESSNLSIISLILRNSSSQLKYNLVTAQDMLGQTPVHYAARKETRPNAKSSPIIRGIAGAIGGDTENSMIHTLLKSVSSKNLIVAALKIKDFKGSTVILEAKRFGNQEPQKTIIELVDRASITDILNEKDNHGRSYTNYKLARTISYDYGRESNSSQGSGNSSDIIIDICKLYQTN